MCTDYIGGMCVMVLEYVYTLLHITELVRLKSEFIYLIEEYKICEHFACINLP